MSVEQQEGTWEQLSLIEGEGGNVRHDARGDRGTGAKADEEQQALAASERNRALASELMERICERGNLNRAYKRVKRNKGAPGVDGMSVKEMLGWLKEHGEELIANLLDGSYEPQAVKGVEIPKPGGGKRQLGIPTAVDRLVQQAILQVLQPAWDPTFSETSYGFRPGRSAQDAVKRGAEYVGEGRSMVVDVDLAKFFDKVNHDILMARVARRVEDKRLLRIIRRFLKAGMMRDGVCVERYQGTPQGGPLSPLLANLLLDDLDKELESRGHRYCRYADDCNIYVRTKAAGERVLASITAYLEGKLKLQVNREKSAVGPAWERKFLGYRILRGGKLGMAPKSQERVKGRIREITRRNRGVALERMIQELNSYLTGWVTYYRYAACGTLLKGLDQWIRRKLRCVKLKQRKRTYGVMTFLRGQGVPEWRAWLLALSGKGWWRKSGSPQAQEAMPIAWFDELGLVSLTKRYAMLNQ